MGLNIKNERVHALAREAARVTGKTQTGAIEEALELLLRESEQARVDKVDRILEVAARWREGVTRPLDDGFTDDDLYDAETGLPA